MERTHGPAAQRTDSASRGDPHQPALSSVELPVRTGGLSWSELWQVPTIVVSLSLIVSGLYFTAGPRPATDFDPAIADVERLIETGELAAAEERVRAMEPGIAAAAPRVQGRFHAAAADLMYLARNVTDGSDSAACRRVLELYAQAIEQGLTLDARRIERRADAMLALNDLAGARECLATLEKGTAASASAVADVAREPEAMERARSRVMRQLAERSLQQPGATYEQLMQFLADYRMDRAIRPTDEVWAVARMAELRLKAGNAKLAVDTLLVEMRRLESRQATGDPNAFGELYTMLGRGYAAMGDEARAQLQLQRALELLTPSDPRTGDALVMLGQLASSRGDLESAQERFHLVVRDFIGTPSYAAGLLGRAEVQSVLGDHEASLADYRTLVQLLKRDRSRQELTAERVAESLCDRHDAALALGRLDRGLEYVAVAEALFTPDDVPLQVLLRLASVNRQLADDLMAQARGGASTDTPEWLTQIDPAVRQQANTLYQRAGDYALRYSLNESAAAAAGGEDWSTALWLAGDSYDLAGRHDLAIEQFTRYRDMRPVDDPRRAETLFRIAQARQARLDFAEAAPLYEQVLADHPRSAIAPKCHVPLARCYVALKRPADGQTQLRRVLSGDQLLKPDAMDYRDALIELGRICHGLGQFPEAIEHLTVAAQRYPDDPRRSEVTFLLADSYRGNARSLAATIEQQPSMPPAEAARLSAQRIAHLQSAQEIFGQVCDETTMVATAPAFQQDLVRRAHLYRADCAFELGQYEQAVQFYEHAARQYSAHHSSMYALVQIVNCYSAMNDQERLGAAHHRALVRLRQLPDDAFNAPDSIMDRAAWERWLEHSPPGPTAPAARAAAAASSG